MTLKNLNRWSLLHFDTCIDSDVEWGGGCSDGRWMC